MNELIINDSFSFRVVLLENYIVFEDGSVYSVRSKKFLKGEITKHGYLQYALYLNSQPFRIRANRLMGYLFLDVPENANRLVVNHKDGDIDGRLVENNIYIKNIKA